MRKVLNLMTLKGVPRVCGDDPVGVVAEYRRKGKQNNREVMGGERGTGKGARQDAQVSPAGRKNKIGGGGGE